MQTWTQQEDCLRSVVLFSSWQSAGIVGLWYCDHKTVIFFLQNCDFAKMKLLNKWSKEAGTSPWGTHWRRDCGRWCRHSQAQLRHGSPPPFLFSHSIVRHALNVVFKCPWCYDHILTLVYLQKIWICQQIFWKFQEGNEYESIATVGEIRVWWRADFQSGSRVLNKT